VGCFFKKRGRYIRKQYLDQRVDFSKRGDGKALFEIVALELLESVNVASGAVARAKDDAPSSIKFNRSYLSTMRHPCSNG